MISKGTANKPRRRNKIRRRVRGQITGTPQRPRLSIFRSNKEIYAQVIDDLNGVTIASASSLKNDQIDAKKMTAVEIAQEVGKQVAQKAKDQDIETVVFDRGGYLYHGRVKALADGAREGGLQF